MSGSVSSATDSTRLPSELVISDESDEDESYDDGDSLPDDDMAVEDSQMSEESGQTAPCIQNTSAIIVEESSGKLGTDTDTDIGTSHKIGEMCHKEVDENQPLCDKAGNVNQKVVQRSPETVAKDVHTNSIEGTEIIDVQNTQNEDDLYLSSTDDEDFDDAVEVSSHEPELEIDERYLSNVKNTQNMEGQDNNLEEVENTPVHSLINKVEEIKEQTALGKEQSDVYGTVEESSSESDVFEKEQSTVNAQEKKNNEDIEEKHNIEIVDQEMGETSSISVEVEKNTLNVEVTQDKNAKLKDNSVDAPEEDSIGIILEPEKSKGSKTWDNSSSELEYELSEGGTNIVDHQYTLAHQSYERPYLNTEMGIFDSESDGEETNECMVQNPDDFKIDENSESTGCQVELISEAVENDITLELSDAMEIKIPKLSLDTILVEECVEAETQNRFSPDPQDSMKESKDMQQMKECEGKADCAVPTDRAMP